MGNELKSSAESLSGEKTGIISNYNPDGTARIVCPDGKIYHVRFGFSVDVDTFNELRDGTPVRFEEVPEPEGNRKGPLMMARNVRIDVPAATETVARGSHDAALDIVDIQNAPFETKIASLRSILEHGNKAVEDDEGYVAVKSHVDAAYAILRTVDPTTLSAEEKAIFDEIGAAHNDLSMELAMMDELTE